MPQVSLPPVPEPPVPERCPACELATVPGARYCERCGRDLARLLEPCWLVSSPLANSCAFDLELDAVAGVTDRGRHRQRNEDALAIGRLGRNTAAVVCDGVSSSSRSDQAAVAAAEAGIRALLGGLADGHPPVAATRAGARAAAAAAAAQARTLDDNPPCCTYVSAAVTAGEVVVGWVGDSPAYWLAAGGARRLTVDDSLAGRLAAGGVPASDGRYADPQAYALDRWLGADAARVTPHVEAFTPSGPGLVLVCSDGLSRYLAEGAAGLAAAPAGTPTETVRGLLEQALAAGGHDNITVAALAFPPPDRADPPGGLTS